jgi:predicted  nucleic acid-binding Zn-ribbon protein
MNSFLLVLVLTAAPDAGVTSKPAAIDAGVVPASAALPAVNEAPSNLEQERLRKRVAELESRAAALERQIKQLEAVSRKIDQTNDDLEAFKKEVTEREDARRESERRVAEQKQRYENVTRSLVTVDQQLSTGSTNVNEALRSAETTYTGTALQYVQAARASLANGDLSSARRYLLLAVLEAQSTKP